MEKNGLRIGLEKCHFLKSTINFLGHEISASGLKPLTKSCKELMEIDPPEDIKQLQRFLGFTNFYRKHIRHFASLALLLCARNLLTIKNMVA